VNIIELAKRAGMHRLSLSNNFEVAQAELERFCPWLVEDDRETV